MELTRITGMVVGLSMLIAGVRAQIKDNTVIVTSPRMKACYGALLF